MTVYASGKRYEDYGLPENVTLQILSRWWYRRNEVGLPGDEWYIPENQGRQEMIWQFYETRKTDGTIPSLTPEQHGEGFAAYRARMKK